MWKQKLLKLTENSNSDIPLTDLQLNSNAVGWCQVWDNVSSQNECQLKTDEKMAVFDESEQMKLYISVMLKIVTKAEIIMNLST